MLDWLSDNRAVIAAILSSLPPVYYFDLYIGLQQSVLRAKDEVFGDPERTQRRLVLGRYAAYPRCNAGLVLL